MGFWTSSSGRDFIKRGMDSKAARASFSVGLDLGTGPVIDEAILSQTGSCKFLSK